MKKIVKASLTDQIFDYIQEEILKGTWKPGEKLPSETELAASLGVSRMSLRSAIQRSCAMGLTETRVGEGTFVRRFSLRSYFAELYRMGLLGGDPNEINDLRHILQIGSGRLAMLDGIDPADLAVLEQLNAEMERSAAANDMAAFHTADVQFHRAVCELCKNRLMYMIYDAVEAVLDDVTAKNVQRSVEQAGNFDNVLEHHRELLESLRTADIDRFTKAMMESRERSLRYYPKAAARPGAGPAGG